MKKVLIIGCPGSGKSVFSRELEKITHLPLYPLDMIYWRKDRTIIPQEEFLEHINKIITSDEWIMDGNYDSSMEMRMAKCDTIFFLDYPTDVCYEGIMKRRGTVRPDIPWVEPSDEIDDYFINFVLNFNKVNRPVIYERLNKFKDKEIHIFNSRIEASDYLDSLKESK